MVFVLAEEDAMFTADNVLGQGTAVFEDMSEYLRSLHQMRELFSGRAYPGHGPVVEDGPGKITEYIEHRQQRVDQVLQTMRGDDDGIDASGTKWSAMDLVKIIYSDVPVHSTRRLVTVFCKFLKSSPATARSLNRTEACGR
ncbi:hypothetical protein J3459_008118 [Metarhizium acridum]|nr:hypothetical protein J3459_008118 [Metarhizium acridum]